MPDRVLVTGAAGLVGTGVLDLLRERGILKSDSKYYISTVHTDEDVRFTLDAFASAIRELKPASAA